MYTLSPSFLKRRLIKYIEKNQGQMYSEVLRKIYKSQYNISIGYGSYGGCFSPQYIPSGVSFGNYCSIGQNVKIFRANHPRDTFTTHPLLYNPVAGYVENYMLNKPKLDIGNDVWIGESAIILPNVKVIGNGVIIGAGSIVTKDVPAYSIAVGNPARVIGSRFSKKTIEELESTKWWELDKDSLVKKISYLNKISSSNEN